MKETAGIRMVKIEDVCPNPGNPRRIREDAFRRLVRSLKDSPDLFMARPLLCSDRTGRLVVLGGNMRLKAAKELGYGEVPVIVMKGLTERREKEIAVKDNGDFGEWDFDVLANEWSDLPLIDWGVDLPGEWMAPIPEENKLIDEAAMAVTKHECPSCGFKW